MITKHRTERSMLDDMSDDDMSDDEFESLEEIMDVTESGVMGKVVTRHVVTRHVVTRHTAERFCYKIKPRFEDKANAYSFRKIATLTRFLCTEPEPLGGWVVVQRGDLFREEWSALLCSARDVAEDMMIRKMHSTDWQRVARECFARCGTDPTA